MSEKQALASNLILANRPPPAVRRIAGISWKAAVILIIRHTLCKVKNPPDFLTFKFKI